MDEVIYPLFSSEKGDSLHLIFRLICSETSSNHMIFVAVEGLGEDPLGEKYIDKLSREIIEAKCKAIFSSQIGEDDWEICIQL